MSDKQIAEAGAEEREIIAQLKKLGVESIRTPNGEIPVESASADQLEAAADELVREATKEDQIADQLADHVRETIRLRPSEERILERKLAIIADPHCDPFEVARARVDALRLLAEHFAYMLYPEGLFEQWADAEWRRAVESEAVQ
jgi:hypothetical protein